jgi:hypothetical protein
LIKKDELISRLKGCLDTEEKAIVIYTRHFNNVLFLAQLDKEHRDKIRDLLKLLKEQSEKHKDLFINLIKKIIESKQDVY